MNKRTISEPGMHHNAMPLTVGLMLGIVSMGEPAQAQQQPSDRRASTIEEVIVTARRVEESLQDTPVSVAAFTESELEQIGTSEVTDIARYTPNLEMRRTVGSLDTYAMAIRGMSISEVTQTMDPPIGVYVDGVYLARNTGMAFDIVDLERIEVLRGPQGTLFGRNTIGGAINIITAKPRGEFAFKQELGYGARERQRFYTTVDTPQLGNFAVKLSFLRFEHGGLVSSVHTGEMLGQRESTGFRAALNWTPAESVNIDYSFDLSRRKSNPNISQLTHVRPMVADPDGEFYGGAFFEELARHSSPDRLGQLPVRSTGMPSHADMDAHAVTVEWEASPNLVVKSISSYRERDGLDRPEFGTVRAPADGSLCSSPNPGTYDFVTGTCADPVPAGKLVSGFESIKLDQEQEQWSQELQFIGSAFNDRFRYTTGLYYFQEEGSDENPQRLVIAAPIAALSFSAATGIPEELVIPQNRGNSILIDLPNFAYTTDNRAYAVYGDFTYTVLPRLEVTLGLRYSVDERETTLTNTLENVLVTLKDDNSWDNFNPALTVSYRWTDEVSTYAKVVTGYRTGGYDVRVRTADAFFSPFDEENVTSYEVGWKTDLFERSLRFNGAVYYANYSDRQISSLRAGAEGAGVQTINAGEAVHSGVELEGIWLPFAGMRLTASYSYLDVDFQKFPTQRLDPVTAMAIDPGTVVDISDEAKSPYSPEQSAFLAAEYQFTPWQWGQLVLRVDANYTDALEFNPQLAMFTTSRAHALLNARVTLADIPAGGNGTLRVAAWGKNLTNEAVREFGADFGILGFTQNNHIELASYGVDLMYTFNR